MLDLIYLIEKGFLRDDGSQSHLVFESLTKFFKTTNNDNSILEWKSEGLSLIKLLNLQILIFNQK